MKLLDLENMNCSLDEIVREAQVSGLTLAWAIAALLLCRAIGVAIDAARWHGAAFLQ